MQPAPLRLSATMPNGRRYVATYAPSRDGLSWHLDRVYRVWTDATGDTLEVETHAQGDVYAALTLPAGTAWGDDDRTWITRAVFGGPLARLAQRLAEREDAIQAEADSALAAVRAQYAADVASLREELPTMDGPEWAEDITGMESAANGAVSSW